MILLKPVEWLEQGDTGRKFRYSNICGKRRNFRSVRIMLNYLTTKLGRKGSFGMSTILSKCQITHLYHQHIITKTYIGKRGSTSWSTNDIDHETLKINTIKWKQRRKKKKKDTSAKGACIPRTVIVCSTKRWIPRIASEGIGGPGEKKIRSNTFLLNEQEGSWTFQAAEKTESSDLDPVS